MRKKIIIIVQEYPQISETYIKNEVDVLAQSYDIEILSLSVGNYPYRTRKPHIVLNKKNLNNVISYLRNFGASIIHTHYLHLSQDASLLAKSLKIPYTVRTHSFDILGRDIQYIENFTNLINADECLGVLTFPCTRDILLESGMRSDKLHNCFPVVDYQRFYNEAANGKSVMNVGAAIPKKNMESYLELSKLVPEREFNLYAMGYQVKNLVRMKDQLEAKVKFIPPVDPEEMPREYKKHEWLVYTGSHTIPSVGWPMAIAEAQASGVGVLMANIRPDLSEYVGDAGYLYDSIEEAAEILRTPFPASRRQRGFSLAKRSDIRTHISQLTEMWLGPMAKA